MLSGTDVSDEQLVARCRQGDEQAWNDLVQRFSRYVLAIAAQGFRLSDADAEDVFQEVFARVYVKLDTLRDDASVRAWIGQLTRRLATDRLRLASNRETPAEKLPDPGAIDVALERIDLALDVHEAMRVLPGNCREILDRFFARDQSYQTIAGELGIPAGTIASRISRCLTKLRSELEGR
jgi:RNA polymerase sigma-70 factor (ECF subfamily)